MAGEKWMYDLFGTTGKSIYERQQKQCKASGGSFNRKTGACDKGDKKKESKK